MGWREVITQTVWDYTGCTDARAETTCAGIEDRLADMPAPDRIALARELLAGTGWRLMQQEIVGEVIKAQYFSYALSADEIKEMHQKGSTP